MLKTTVLMVKNFNLLKIDSARIVLSVHTVAWLTFPRDLTPKKTPGEYHLFGPRPCDVVNILETTVFCGHLSLYLDYL